MIPTDRNVILKTVKGSIFIILFICISTHLSVAQVLNGNITDMAGHPVPYATVFIHELKYGTTSNTKGDYEIKLPAGSYLVTFQSLGYEPVTENIKIATEVLTKNIVLPEEIYDIPEVRINPSGEDPAMFIMRKAIGLAPYYLNYISYYKAEVYLKGNLLIRNIPKIFERSMRMNRSENNLTVSAGKKQQDQTNTIKEGDLYLMESFNEIEFTAPDKYIQRVISYNSTFPEQGNEVSPMSFIQASFYQPVLADMAISPLSPQAFSYYRFRYDGATLQGNYTVNKIEVIPKRKSQQLFEGTIYIIEDLWCLHSVDLTNENLVGIIRIKELYAPVQEEIWMPVSHQFDINLKIFGFKADAGYTSSVKYLDVKPNENLHKPQDLITGFAGSYNFQDTVKSRNKQEIERLLQKDELSNRDMIKLSRLMDKETYASRPDSSKSLEIKDNTTRIVEKGAAGKDSSYWFSVRPIPLSETELQSLHKSDSIKKLKAQPVLSVSDTSGTPGGKKRGAFKNTMQKVMSGHTWRDTTGFSFTYGGLINPDKLSFNTVDGFVYGTDFRISKQIDRRNRIAFYPDIRYAFSREKLMWRLNGNYSIGGMNPQQFYIRSGITSKDIGTGGSINTLVNSLTSLLLKENYLKLYESRYLNLGYNIDLKNGLGIELSFGYDNRKVLENNTTFSIFRTGREYSENIPVNDYLLPDASENNFLNDQKHYEIVTNVTFTPNQKYRVVNGTRVPQESTNPVFRFTWKHGINQTPAISDNSNHYDMVRLEVSQRRETGAFSEIKWNIRTGGFLDNRKISFFDFFHFNSQSFPLLINEFDDAFMLPEFYSLSTPEVFGEAHLKYTTPYLLLKLIPGLSNTLIRENISAGFLGSRFRPTYFEAGYSLSEIFLLGEAGIYAGFENLKYSNIGIKFTLRLN